MTPEETKAAIISEWEKSLPKQLSTVIITNLEMALDRYAEAIRHQHAV